MNNMMSIHTNSSNNATHEANISHIYKTLFSLLVKSQSKFWTNLAFYDEQCIKEDRNKLGKKKNLCVTIYA